MTVECGKIVIADGSFPKLEFNSARVRRFIMKKQLLLSAAVGVLGAVSPAMAQPPAPPRAPVYSWTGFYGGINAGYSWGHGAVTYTEPALGDFGLPTSYTSPSNLDGAIGGVQIGYNWQINYSWVIGLEADLQLADEKASSNFSSPYTVDCEGGCTLTGSLGSKIDWFGTVRGRLGWLYNPTAMVYATGGLAYGRVNAWGFFSDSFCAPPCSWGFNQAATNFGYAAGGGIEAAFPNSPNWTWKIEYLYIDLGSLRGSGFDNDFNGAYTWNARFTDNILRFGVNWYFH